MRGWDAVVRDDSIKLAADDLDRLVFRKRAVAGSRREKSSSAQMLCVGLALVGAFVFVLLVRTLLARTSGTADSPVEMPLATDSPESNASPTVREPLPQADVPDSQVPMVYRCVSKGGGVSLQSQRCAPSQRETLAVYAPPEAEPVRPVAVVSPSPAAVNYAYSEPARDDERDRSRVECANAKSTRDETLARVGLNRTYELLQQLDAMVQEACKGQ